jgi:N-methylhydantoinase B
VPGIIFSARSDSHTVGVPTGVSGGHDGRRARLVKNHGKSNEEILFSKIAHLELDVGESIRLETAGGGGYGDPALRPTELVRQDMRDGKVSSASARTHYGVEP